MLIYVITHLALFSRFISIVKDYLYFLTLLEITCYDIGWVESSPSLELGSPQQVTDVRHACGLNVW